MDRKTLVETINNFVTTNNLSPSVCTVAGIAASFLLDDVAEFKTSTVDIAIASGNSDLIKVIKLNDLRFNCYEDNASWASYKQIEDSSLFVVTTRGRKRK